MAEADESVEVEEAGVEAEEYLSAALPVSSIAPSVLASSGAGWRGQSGTVLGPALGVALRRQVGPFQSDL